MSNRLHPHHDGYLFVLSDDGTPQCQKCGFYHSHEMLPVVRYIELDPPVLQVDCRRCGFSKSVKPLDQWIADTAGAR